VTFYLDRRGKVVCGVTAATGKVDELVFIGGEFSAMSLSPCLALRMGVGQPATIGSSVRAVGNQVCVVDKAKP
jgi:hypothetical protein